MAMPLSQDYNEAIQTPAACFGDPELKQGEVVTNAMGLPMPCSGNFADVYAVTTPQRKWAVKCFTRQIPGLRERYIEISKYLAQVKLPFMVEFSFLEKGIRVRNDWFPILKMHWVEGFSLNAFVRDNVEKPQLLDILCQIWVRLAARLHEADLAHCDLQHGNVLLVPGSKAGSLGVRLVDYDGMCVPSLTMLKSIEVGHPNFQHPQRAREGIYNLEVDRFSHLVIYTALRALIGGGKGLWQKYDNGDNLLFKQPDLEDPARSAVFQELSKHGDAAVKMLAATLAEAAKKPLEEAPLLEELAAKLPASVTAIREKPVPVKVAGGATEPVAEDIFAEATLARKEDGAAKKPPKKEKEKKAKKSLETLLMIGSLAGLVIAAAVIFLVVSLGNGKKSDSTSSTIADVSPADNKGTTLPTNPPANPAPRTPPVNELDQLGEVTAVLRGHTGPVFVLAYSPDGKTLASGGGTDNTVCLWDLAGRQPPERKVLQGHLKGINSLAFAPDGRTLATNSYDGTVRFWDPIQGTSTRVTLATSPEYGADLLSFAPDGKTLAARSADGAIQLWDLSGPEPKERAVLRGHEGLVDSLGFSPDSTTLASGGRDGTIRLWDLSGPLIKERAILRGHGNWVRSLAFAPDGKTLVSGSKDRTVRVWDLSGPEPHERVILRDHVNEVLPVRFAPDGKTFVSMSGLEGRLILWDAASSNKLKEWRTGRTQRVAYSPDSRHLAVTHDNSSVYILRLPTTEPTTEPRPTDSKDSSVDLLALINPEKHAVHGKWHFQERTLVSPGDAHARLQIPYAPPEEYSVKAVVEREQGSANIVFGLVARGQFMVVIDGWGGQVTELDTVDGKRGGDNVTSRRGPLLVNGKRHQIVCTVRKKQITVTIDGNSVIVFEGEHERLSLPADWPVPEKRALFLGSHCVYHISELKLTPLSEAKLQRMIIVPTSREQNCNWRYTFNEPAKDWFKKDFNHTEWKQGLAGFGTQGTPGANIGTEWKTSDVWLRREFVLPELAFNDARLLLHHDDDAEVYINGVLAAEVPGYSTSYEDHPMNPEARAALKPGKKNVLAVHCRQKTGGQYIDVGMSMPLNLKPGDLYNTSLGCIYMPGVRESGFHGQEIHDDNPVRWTDGNARLSVPIDQGNPPEALSVKLVATKAGDGDRPWKLRILVNGQELFNDMFRGGFEKTFNLKNLKPADEALIELLSEKFQPTNDGRMLGIMVSDIRLIGAKRPKQPRPEVARLPLPDAEALTKAEKEVRQLYKSDYANAKKDTASRREFASRLFKTALDTKDNEVSRFLLFREARDLAAQGGDFTLAFETVDEAAREFAIDALAMKTAALNLAVKIVTTPETSKDLAEAALTLIDEAVAGDNYVTALDLLKLAESAVQKAKNPQLSKLIAKRGLGVRDLQKEHEAAQKALERVKENQDDPEANLLAGKFLCLKKGDWDKGLPLLVKSSDEKLKLLARKDLTGPKEPSAQADVGDGWWELAVAEPTKAKVQMHRRAHHWYQEAVKGLSGIAQARVEKRVGELRKQYPELKPPLPVGLIRTFQGHTKWAWNVVFTPDGSRALSAGGAWDDKEIRPGDNDLFLWDVETGVLLRRFEGHAELVTGLTISADGRKALSGSHDKTIRLWDLESGKQLQLFKGDAPRHRCVAFSPDGSKVLSGNDGDKILIWDPKTGRQIGTLQGHTTVVSDIVFSPNGQQLLTGSYDKSVRLWDWKTGRQLASFLGHTEVDCVAFSPDGRRALTGGEDTTLRVWDLRTGKQISLIKGHPAKIWSVAYLPDGRQAVTGCRDWKIRLWDLSSGKLLHLFEGHQGEVFRVRVSPDGRTLLSGSGDSTVRLWGLPK